MDKEKKDMISIIDAIKLKHLLNSSIKYHGLNSSQVKEAEILDEEQYQELERQLSEIKKNWSFFPNWFWVAIIIAALVLIFTYQNIKVITVGFAIMIYCFSQLAYRSGMLYGYFSGFERGHSSGVHKMLGLNKEDSKEIDETALEMEIDEMVLNRNNRENDS